MKTISEQLREPGGLRRYLVPWGIYIDGARDMLLKLLEHGLIGNVATKAEDRIYNKAIIDLLLSSKDAMDRFLTEDYSEIRLTDHKRDKKGKLLSCRAYFAEKITIYKEL